MSTDVIAFIGPSLASDAAAAIAPFAYRAPAAQGDVLQAVRDGARAIGLVDGYFEGVPAVWHKEILFALSSGVHVFGAASMGALRAAELAPFGMRGIGRIFAWYRDGTIDADDEVALIHGPHEMGFVPLSEPLVNVRGTIIQAGEAGAIDAGLANDILSAARGLFYKERTWPSILDALDLVEAERKRLAASLAEHRVDQKRQDAVALIEAMATLVDAWPGRFEASFQFEPTDAWNLGIDSIRPVAVISEFDRRVLDEARFDAETFGRLVDAAALAIMPESGRLAPELPERSRRLDRFRSQQGLQDRSRFSNWLEQNALSAPELDRLLAAREKTELLVQGMGEALEAALIGEIKLRGLYGPFAARAAKKASALSSRPTGQGVPPLQLLVEWFFEKRRLPPPDLEHYCRKLALPDREALQELLAREYVFASLDG